MTKLIIFISPMMVVQKNNQTNKIKYLTNLTRNWTLVTNKMKSRVGYSGTPLLAAAYHSIQTRVLPSSTANWIAIS